MRTHVAASPATSGASSRSACRLYGPLAATCYYIIQSGVCYIIITRTLWGERERVVVCLKTTFMHVSSSATDHYDRSSGALYIYLLSVSILSR